MFGAERVCGAETNCRIADMLGILLMISYWFAFYFSDIIVVSVWFNSTDARGSNITDHK